MPKMRTSFQGLVRVLAQTLYPEPDVFIRELLQNAHDSIQLRQVSTPQPDGKICIDVDDSNRILSFSDNGAGMDQRDIEDFLSVIGSSGSGSRARELTAHDVAVATIGQFGIGLLSAFVVAERIEVCTRKIGATHGWRWVNHGGEDYDLEALPIDVHPSGTKVVVTLAADQIAFLDGRLIRRVVRRYADFLPFPIWLNSFGPINAVNAPWHESTWQEPATRESSLVTFLNQRYADPPLLVIPIDIAKPRVQGGLFIAARYAPTAQTGGTLDVFQARMCIRLDDNELLPKWAQFVRGIVDCPMLQPTAARDNVVRDTTYHALREALSERIIAALLDLAARDRPRFLQLCEWRRDAIKGMVMQHLAFSAAVLEILPFETNQGQLTLPDYLFRQPPTPDGRRPLYFFVHEADANQFHALCQAQGWLAVNAGHPFDEALLRRYADQHPDLVELRPLDQMDDLTLYQRLGPDEEAAYDRLAHAMNQAVDAMDARVHTQVRRFQPATLSAVVIAGQRIAAFDDMERALEKPFLLEGLAELAGEVRNRLRQQPLTLFLNALHPLVQRLGTLENLDDPRYRPLLGGLYHGALLNAQHRLTPAAARRFHSDFQALLLEYLRLQIQMEPSSA